MEIKEMTSYQYYLTIFGAIREGLGQAQGISPHRAGRLDLDSFVSYSLAVAHGKDGHGPLPLTSIEFTTALENYKA